MNRVIDGIDLDGLEYYSVTDKNGNERANGNYGDDTDTDKTIDVISQSDQSCIDNICFQDVGPKTHDRNDPVFGAVREVYHQMTYSYSGTDEVGNLTTGSGSIEVPVTQYRISAGMIDIAFNYAFGKALGALQTYRLSKLNQTAIKNSNADEVFEEFVGNGVRNTPRPFAPTAQDLIDNPAIIYSVGDDLASIVTKDGFTSKVYTGTSSAVEYTKTTRQGIWSVVANYGGGRHSGTVFSNPYYYKITGPNYTKTKIIDPHRYPRSEWIGQTKWRIIDGTTGNVLKKAGEKLNK